MRSHLQNRIAAGCMRRREFITIFGSTAAAWPLAARAQQPAMPVVGFLTHGSPENTANLVAAFRRGLSETGFVEGQNLTIEFRWANNDSDRLPALAADLVRRRVAVIATPLSTAGALAAKAATGTIPIVVGVGTDPVQIGLVPSFNRPGGNITGIAGMNWELGAKRLGLLHELLPSATRFGILVDPNNRDVAGPLSKQVQAAAAALGRQIEVHPAATSNDIDTIFEGFARQRIDGLMVTPDQLFLSRRVQIVGLCLRHGVPALFPWREAVEIGGLMSYASSIADLYRQVGLYVGRVLKGEKPGDTPVMQASKFEFVINLQTAKALGVKFSDNLLSLADEVIE
jgi:putative tryptophan/tyrosine transport system substrate-binding protein